MNDQPTIMAVLAHPDDENGMGGTLARYAAQGVRVFLVTASRGEAGTIFNPELATPETIAAVREAELRCSCAALGIEPPILLDCPDMGVRECVEVALEKVVRLVRQLRPQIMITFGPDGIYGHPDHIAAHQMAAQAWRLAGNSNAFPAHFEQGLAPHTPARLFYHVLPASFVQEWRRHADLTVELAGERLQITGVPDEQISLRLDVTPYIERKAAAWACHRTQFNPNGPRNLMSQEELERWMRTEYFILAGGVPLPSAPTPADLFAGLESLEHAHDK